jgi:hypothetical protein
MEENFAHLEQLIVSCDPVNIELAIQLAEGLGINLEEVITQAGFNIFGLQKPRDFIKKVCFDYQGEIGGLKLLARLPDIELVEIYAPVSEAEIEDFKKSHPNCTVVCYFGYQ